MSRLWLLAGALGALVAGAVALGYVEIPEGAPDAVDAGGVHGNPLWAKHVLTLGDPRTSGLAKWPGEFDAPPVKAYDFDGDGTDEVVAYSTDGKVYVFHGRTGRALATLTTTLPPAWHVERVLNGVEAGVLAPGQPPSIVVANPAAYVSVWTFRADRSTADGFAFDKAWEKRLPAVKRPPSMDSKPVLADLDRDGDLELVLQTEEMGVHALHHDGALLWTAETGGGNSSPAVGDLEGDGAPEVVLASDGGRIGVLEGSTGRWKWSFDARPYVQPASVPIAPTIADLDGVPPKEVLFVARDAHDPSSAQANHVAVLAVRGAHGRGELVWMFQAPWANPLSYTQLVVHDVTGDGSPEVFGMDWNTMGHRPGDWEHTGPAHVFSLTAQGHERWVREVDAWWSNKDIALADVDGDGAFEVLVNGARGGIDGLWVFDAATGKPEDFIQAGPWKVSRGPVLAARPEGLRLLLPVRPMADGDVRGAILAFDLALGRDPVWPGYAPV